MRGGHERSPRFFSPALGTFLTYFYILTGSKRGGRVQIALDGFKNVTSPQTRQRKSTPLVFL